MSNIVVFKPGRSRRSVSATEAHGRPAQILFFTGVRYVRTLELDEAVAVASPRHESEGPHRDEAARLQA